MAWRLSSLGGDGEERFGGWANLTFVVAMGDQGDCPCCCSHLYNRSVDVTCISVPAYSRLSHSISAKEHTQSVRMFEMLQPI